MSTASRTAHRPEAARVPELVPSDTSEEIRPRRLAGAYSARSTVAPAISAPAPNPWASRSTTSRIGAMMPMVP